MGLVSNKKCTNLKLTETQKVTEMPYSQSVKDALQDWYAHNNATRTAASICNAILTNGCPVLMLSRRQAEDLIAHDDNITKKFSLSGNSRHVWGQAQSLIEANDIVEKIRPQQGKAGAIYRLLDLDMRREMAISMYEQVEEKLLTHALEIWDRLSQVKTGINAPRTESDEVGCVVQATASVLALGDPVAKAQAHIRTTLASWKKQCKGTPQETGEMIAQVCKDMQLPIVSATYLVEQEVTRKCKFDKYWTAGGGDVEDRLEEFRNAVLAAIATEYGVTSSGTMDERTRRYASHIVNDYLPFWDRERGEKIKTPADVDALLLERRQKLQAWLNNPKNEAELLAAAPGFSREQIIEVLWDRIREVEVHYTSRKAELIGSRTNE